MSGSSRFANSSRRLCGALAVAALPFAVLTAAAPAEARIKCVAGDQIVNGSPIATPYCQDELVAVVARQNGFKVSADEIRNNPNTKRTICRFVGRDIRLSTACVNENSVRRPF